jgi:hypothetical protein
MKIIFLKTHLKTLSKLLQNSHKTQIWLLKIGTLENNTKHISMRYPSKQKRLINRHWFTFTFIGHAGQCQKQQQKNFDSEQSGSLKIWGWNKPLPYHNVNGNSLHGVGVLIDQLELTLLCSDILFKRSFIIHRLSMFFNLADIFAHIYCKSAPCFFLSIIIHFLIDLCVIFSIIHGFI